MDRTTSGFPAVPVTSWGLFDDIDMSCLADVPLCPEEEAHLDRIEDLQVSLSENLLNMLNLACGSPERESLSEPEQTPIHPSHAPTAAVSTDALLPLQACTCGPAAEPQPAQNAQPGPWASCSTPQPLCQPLPSAASSSAGLPIPVLEHEASGKSTATEVAAGSEETDAAGAGGEMMRALEMALAEDLGGDTSRQDVGAQLRAGMQRVMMEFLLLMDLDAATAAAVASGSFTSSSTVGGSPTTLGDPSPHPLLPRLSSELAAVQRRLLAILHGLEQGRGPAGGGLGAGWGLSHRVKQLGLAAAQWADALLELLQTRLRALAEPTWAVLNLDNPHPSKEKKRQLAQYCRKTEVQVKDWFVNWRARRWRPWIQASSLDTDTHRPTPSADLVNGRKRLR